MKKKNNMKTIIWLDDIRNPIDHGVHNAIWVKDYNSFIEIVLKQHPDIIHFDHDLSNEYHWVDTHPMNEDGTCAKEHFILYDRFVDKTGFHCAEWLVKHCSENSLPLPEWHVHSGNWQGAKNITDFLNLHTNG